MNAEMLLVIADQVGLAVTLTADPSTFDNSERFVAWIGLEAAGAGPTPEAAVRAALADLEGAQPTSAPAAAVIVNR